MSIQEKISDDCHEDKPKPDEADLFLALLHDDKMMQTKNKVYNDVPGLCKVYKGYGQSNMAMESIDTEYKPISINYASLQTKASQMPSTLCNKCKNQQLYFCSHYL